MNRILKNLIKRQPTYYIASLSVMFCVNSLTNEMFGRGKGGKEVAFLNKCKLRWRVLLYRLGRLIDTLAVIKEC